MLTSMHRSLSASVNVAPVTVGYYVNHMRAICIASRPIFVMTMFFLIVYFSIHFGHACVALPLFSRSPQVLESG